jgi:hypothetical protein
MLWSLFQNVLINGSRISSCIATFGKARVLSGIKGDITCHAIRIKDLYELVKVEENIANYK